MQPMTASRLVARAHTSGMSYEEIARVSGLTTRTIYAMRRAAPRRLYGRTIEGMRALRSHLAHARTA